MDTELGSAVTETEDVRTEMTACNLLGCDLLKSRPVLGVKENLVLDPFGDRLLPERRAVKSGGELRCKRRLTATGNLDSATKGGNVRFIHEHPFYTTRVVRQYDPGCVHSDRPVATVLPMPVAREKAPAEAPRKLRVRQAARGPDGYTLGERLWACIRTKARQLGIPVEDYTQTRLIAEATRAVGRDPETDPIITQQGLSLILNNKTSESPAAVAFAVVFGVEATWLQYGYGEPNYISRALKAG